MHELPNVNPNVDQLYRRKVKRLAEELAQHPSSQEPAITLRSLIGEVVLTPEEKRGVPSAHVGHAEEAEVDGALILLKCDVDDDNAEHPRAVMG